MTIQIVTFENGINLQLTLWPAFSGQKRGRIFSCYPAWLRVKFAAGLEFRTAARFKASVWHYNVRYRIMPASTGKCNAHVIQFLIDKVFRSAILFSIWKQTSRRFHCETLFFERAAWQNSGFKKCYCHRSENIVAVTPGKLFLVSCWPPTLDLKPVCARRINLFSVTVV